MRHIIIIIYRFRFDDEIEAERVEKEKRRQREQQLAKMMNSGAKQGGRGAAEQFDTLNLEKEKRKQAEPAGNTLSVAVDRPYEGRELRKRPTSNASTLSTSSSSSSFKTRESTKLRGSSLQADSNQHASEASKNRSVSASPAVASVSNEANKPQVTAVKKVGRPPKVRKPEISEQPKPYFQGSMQKNETPIDKKNPVPQEQLIKARLESQQPASTAPIKQYPSVSSP